MKRATTDWNYHIGRGTGLLISVFFSEANRSEEERSPAPEGFPLFYPNSFVRRPLVSGKLSIFSSLVLSFFFSDHFLSRGKPRFHLPFSICRPRDSSDSRPRRFQSCLVEVSTRPHLPLDIPGNLFPVPSFLSLFIRPFRPRNVC